ncbi:MAG: hypothetical protein Kow0059_21530 [Candidatus Sumerlaeia bacterium]
MTSRRPIRPACAGAGEGRGAVCVISAADGAGAFSGPPAGRVLALALLAVVLSTSGRALLPPGAAAPELSLARVAGTGQTQAEGLTGPRLLVMVRSDQRYTSQVLVLCRHLSDRLAVHPKPPVPVLVWVGGAPAVGSAQANSLPPDWIVLLDPQSSAAQSYNMIVSPTIYLIDDRGIIKAAFAAWSPRLEENILEALPCISPLSTTPTPLLSSEQLMELDRAEIYFRAARNMEAQGNWSSALALYERGLSLSPHNARNLAQAADAALKAGYEQKAEHLARKALQIEPHLPLAIQVLTALGPGPPGGLSPEATDQPVPADSGPRSE